jgi:hypothetical protein
MKYTIVDETYDVKIYTKISDVFNYINSQNMYISDDAVAQPLTLKNLKNAFENERYVWIYEVGITDWVFKIQKHN